MAPTPQSWHRYPIGILELVMLCYGAPVAFVLAYWALDPSMMRLDLWTALPTFGSLGFLAFVAVNYVSARGKVFRCHRVTEFVAEDPDTVAGRLTTMLREGLGGAPEVPNGRWDRWDTGARSHLVLDGRPAARLHVKYVPGQGIVTLVLTRGAWGHADRVDRLMAFVADPP